MRLKITWPGNPEGVDRPITAAPTATVRLEITDDDGAPLRAQVLVKATLEEGSRRQPVIGRALDGTSIAFTISLSKPLQLLPAKLQIAISTLEDERQAELISRPVVSGAMHTLSQSAFAVLCAVSVYLALLFPQLQTVISWLKSQAGVPFMGLLFLVAAAAWREARRLLRLPYVVVPAALVALFVLREVRIYASFVVNNSLQAVGSELGRLEPGERGVLWNFQPSPPLCINTDGKDCVTFVGHADLLARWGELLLLHRQELGCQPQPIPPAYRSAWQKAGSCVPQDGMLIEHADFGQLAGDHSFTQPDRLTLRLMPNAEGIAIERADPTTRWKLSFEAIDGEPAPLDVEPQAPVEPIGYAPRPALQRTSPTVALRLAMRGSDLWPNVETSIARSSRALLLTPFAWEGAGASTVLRADVLVGGIVIGSLTNTLIPSERNQKRVARCWLASSSTRLSGLVLRGPGGTAQWQSASSDFVTEFPLCWTEPGHPQSGELQLDARWAATENWVITLPARLIPDRLTIIQSNGEAAGEVRCKSDGANWMAFGPLSADAPSEELGALKSEGCAWRADERARLTKWFWGCWPAGSRPPQRWVGRARWSLSASSTNAGYGLRQVPVSCHLNVHAEDIRVACKEMSKERKARWFASFGVRRRDCDPDSSVVCE